jgi:NTE family protein
MSTAIKKAVVLSGGGTAGAAWMLGLITALRDDGVNLGDADLIVGTSAGARTGAQLATGVLDQVAEMYRRSTLPEIEVPVKLAEFVAASMRIVAEVGDGPEAARRIANLEPLGPRLASGADRRRMVSASLPVQAWPRRPLVIAAVDAASGRLVAFDADAGVDLVDAVTASGALPGIYPLVAIDGRRYADGGARSLYNADLAAGHDVVIVISPIPLNEYLQSKLDSELAALGPATVHVIVADEASIAAIGPDPLSAAAAPTALAAGLAQAKREIDALQPIWHARENRPA